jgi:hypothetical protein
MKIYKNAIFKHSYPAVNFSPIFTKQFSTLAFAPVNKILKKFKIVSSYYIRFDLRIKKLFPFPSAAARNITPSPATGGSELRVERVFYWGNWNCCLRISQCLKT